MESTSSQMQSILEVSADGEEWISQWERSCCFEDEVIHNICFLYVLYLLFPVQCSCFRDY